MASHDRYYRGFLLGLIYIKISETGEWIGPISVLMTSAMLVLLAYAISVTLSSHYLPILWSKC